MVRLFSFVDTDSDFWKGMKRDISFSFSVSLAIYIFLWNWIEWAMFDKCGQLCGLSKIGPKIANLVQTVGFELLVAVCERVMGGVGREGTGQQARRKWAWVRPNALLSRAERHICSAERENEAHFCVFRNNWKLNWSLGQSQIIWSGPLFIWRKKYCFINPEYFCL